MTIDYISNYLLCKNIKHLVLVFLINFLELINAYFLFLNSDFFADQSQDLLSAKLVVKLHEILSIFILQIIVGDAIESVTHLPANA